MEIPISSSFKKQTAKAIVAIVLFVLFYVVLFTLAVGLTAGCLVLGFRIIVAKPMFFTLVFGLGIASLGVLILIFLVKFMFQKTKTDLSSYTEITRAQEPQLFAFIDAIVKEANTDFPKHVYLSPEVNASVFYNSSFWSMFFPVRKNLHIGMGLINSVTHDELKAILAHEFGHFSQKSMKVGSYVYHVNHIIYNLLYDNGSYDVMVQKLANVSSYFVLFITIAIKIIEGIQWMLQKMYAFVNKKYLALSREMEFHADAVAAHIAGVSPVESSLLRMHLADSSYNHVLNLYTEKMAEGWISENVFKEHSYMMRFLAEKEGIPLVNDLPQITNDDTSNKFVKSKLVIENQWASHPETEERIAAVARLQVAAKTTNTTPALHLFVDGEAMQKRLTSKMFSFVHYETATQVVDFDKFKTTIQAKIDEYALDSLYNGYYNQYSPQSISFAEVANPAASVADLFNDETASWPSTLQTLYADYQTLEGIKNSYIKIRSFDYEGTKYASTEAAVVLQMVKKEIDVLEECLKDNDQLIYRFTLEKGLAQEQAYLYRTTVEQYLAGIISYEENMKLIDAIHTELHFISEQNSYEYILSKFRQFEATETNLKSGLQSLLKNELLDKELTIESRNRLHDYIAKEQVYFAGTSYDDAALNLLFEAKNTFYMLTEKLYYKNKKAWLDLQASILKNA